MLPRLLAPDRPDWRWVRVVELSGYANAQAVARLQSEDRQTRKLYAFKRALDRGASDTYAVYHAAHYLHNSLPEQRFILEGMLLAGADNPRVAQQLALGDQGLEVVQAYHDTFFEVRPYLDKPAWITAAVLEGPSYRAHQHDRKGLTLRLAWLLGLQVFEELMFRAGRSTEAQSVICELVEGIMHSHVAELAFSAGSRSELPEWVGGFLGRVEDQRRKGGAGGDDYAEAISSFLGGMGLSVADPTDERNLSLPAREPRAVEYREAEAHVG